VGFLLSRWVTEPLGRLTRYAEAVARGERPPPPRLPGRQLGTLAESLGRMHDALEDRNYVQSYVRTLSHEMKAPVAAIRGASELLEEELPTERREQFLANIRTESARLQNLIEQLLALASLENRRRLENPQDIDLSAVATCVANELRSRGDNIVLHAEEGCTVSGDEFLLETALRNLIQNAVEFSPPGAAVEVSIAHEDGRIVARILDAGPGIPDYAAEKVFDRFYSLPRPATGRKSTGLGLCFVREAAALHGGEASLSNRSSHPGAEAKLDLPSI
jgi:two-component system sensor histidine kinase CreC